MTPILPIIRRTPTPAPTFPCGDREDSQNFIPCPTPHPHQANPFQASRIDSEAFCPHGGTLPLTTTHVAPPGPRSARTRPGDTGGGTPQDPKPRFSAKNWGVGGNIVSIDPEGGSPPVGRGCVPAGVQRCRPHSVAQRCMSLGDVSGNCAGAGPGPGVTPGWP